jgi:quinol monooxygenase YgiN
MKKLLLLSFFSLFFMVSAYAQTEKVKSEVKSKTLTVNIYYTGTNGSARAFVNEMKSSGTVDAIRSEAGNLRYEYFFPEDDPETVLLIDSWESQEAIDKHHATPMMNAITTLREKYDLHMKVERYVSAEEPTTDEKFIRK